MSNQKHFPVWKTIKLGFWRTPKDYERYLESHLVVRDSFPCLPYFSTCAREILQKVIISEFIVEVDLCKKSVRQLGFKGDFAPFEDVSRRIIEVGGELCPAEVGPALRLQYDEQPYGERSIIAMKGIPNSEGTSLAFEVSKSRSHIQIMTYGNCSSSMMFSHFNIIFLFPLKVL